MRQTIGAFLSELRREHGYTQQEIADKLGISNRTLSAWETDKRYPDILLLPALAELYGVTADEILRGERNPSDNGAKADVPAEDGNRDRADGFSGESEKLLYRNRLSRYRTQAHILCTVFGASVALAVLSLFFLISGGETIGTLGAVFISVSAVAQIVCAGLTVAFYRSACTVVPSAEGASRDGKNYRFLLAKIIASAMLFEIAVLALFTFSLWIALGMRTNPSAVSFVFVVAGALLVVLMLLLSAASMKERKTWSDEENAVGLTRNLRLYKKCFLYGMIPAMLSVAAATVFSFWQPTTQAVLCSFSSREELVRHMQTLAVDENNALHIDGNLPVGEYYFDVGAIMGDIEDKDYRDAGNGFSMRYVGGEEIELHYDLGDTCMAMSLYPVVLSDGTRVWNIRYGDLGELDRTETGGMVYSPWGVSFRVPIFVSDVYVDEENGGYALCRTVSANYSSAVCSATLIVSAVDIAVCAVVYHTKKSKVTVTL